MDQIRMSSKLLCFVFYRHFMLSSNAAFIQKLEKTKIFDMKKLKVKKQSLILQVQG